MKTLFLLIIRGYRKWISPLKRPTCRFRPTCSLYALEAISTFGALKGGLMTFLRICRCNPFFDAGYDPVPDHFTLKSEISKTRK